MISILEHLHQYVPKLSPTNAEENEEQLHRILLGGDQLSTAMVRRVKAQRTNSTSLSTSLDGVEPVCEDWHTKMCFLTVSTIC